MTDTTLDTKTAPEATDVAQAAPAVEPSVDTQAPARDDRRGGPRGRAGGRPGGRDSRGRGPRAPRERSEFEQATLEVRRVARVMAGGRRFSFSVTVVIGDKKGRVGVGLGKGADTARAIDKAVRDAKKHLVTVNRTADGSIAHDVSTKYASSIVTIVPSPGRGVVAGSAMRAVLEHAGVTNVVAKILTRTKNKLTIARATVAALASAGTR
ncbi:MAG TPA: 30S ribosomal protein S5 [Candidatus Paceibacterota bacterium]